MGREKINDSTFYVMRRAGRAIRENGMLEDQTRAVVALSGGRTSAACLLALLRRQERIPIDVHFFPVHVPDAVHGPRDEVRENLSRFCSRLELELHVRPEVERPSDRFSMCPHRERLAQAAGDLGCDAVVLGTTIRDRGLHILVRMVREGLLVEVPLVESFVGPTGAIRFVRPLGQVIDDAVEQMARDEQIVLGGIPILRPDAELMGTLDRFLVEKKGSVVERYRNVVKAPGRLKEEYMV